MKKFFALLTVLIMCLSLVACGEEPEKKTESESAEQDKDLVAEKNEVLDSVDITRPTIPEVTQTTEAVSEETAPKPVEIGDTYLFGNYEQDNDTDNGKEVVEWLVLDKTEDSLLLISKYALDCQPYHNEHISVNWENCSLRTWLNSDFYDAAFTDREKERIMTTDVQPDTHDCDYLKEDQGGITSDKVFLLSVAEAENYFPSMDYYRQCSPTAYAVAQGAFLSSMEDYADKGWWWLRTALDLNECSAMVYVTGTVNCGCGTGTGGSMVDSKGGTVRPVIWLSMSE